MAEMTSAGPVGLSPEQEEEAFYHEAALNAAWTGSRLMVGVVASGLGAFVFAYFYLRSLNSHGLWYIAKSGNGQIATVPSIAVGTVIMGLIVVSAVLQSLGLSRIKAGQKGTWQSMAMAAMLLGFGAVVVQAVQLGTLPFQPGGSGFASVFVGTSPVFAILVGATMIWLEMLVMRARKIQEISFVEQPPTFDEAAEVQRFQANLSAFTLFWNFLAVAAVVLWVLFYLVH
jgi:hypothetical protein